MQRQRERERECRTYEVDDKSAIGEAAGGVAEVSLAVRKMADRLDNDAAVYRISGVRDRVAEAEDGSIASDGRAGEEQEQHDEEAKAAAGGHRRGGTANHLSARFALERNFSPELGIQKKR